MPFHVADPTLSRFACPPIAQESHRKQKHEPIVVGSLADAAIHCSSTERRADEASRDVVAWLKCEFMSDKIGDCFDGLVTGVTGFGIFVTLNDNFIEGLVHITALPRDYYQFDGVSHELTGERSKRSYRLADKVNVRLLAVSLEERKIDFELVSTAKARKNKR